jgi:N-acetylmuramoyl-L-alanine amidase
MTPVAGWTFDNVELTNVQILVDGVVNGLASYGESRPDVAHDYPNTPVDVGFSYQLDTTKFANGPHVLNVQATDTNGNVALFSDLRVVVSN